MAKGKLLERDRILIRLTVRNGCYDHTPRLSIKMIYQSPSYSIFDSWPEKSTVSFDLNNVI